MAAGFPGNPSCPSGRPDHPPVRAGYNVLFATLMMAAEPEAQAAVGWGDTTSQSTRPYYNRATG
eukprot:1175401-Prorocentrum_minimum.AAC.4